MIKCCPLVNENTNVILIIYESRGLMKLKGISVSQNSNASHFTICYFGFLFSLFS